MYLDSFKEYISSDLYCDALLAGGQNRHLRKAINNHKNTVISLLGGQEARHVVHGDGFPWHVRSRQRGVRPCFSVVCLAIMQVVQDLIYLLTSCQSFGQ
jgi:hypothetical protein